MDRSNGEYYIIEYIYKTMSGKIAERPKRKELLAKLNKGGCGIIVDTFAWWGRGTADAIVKVEEVAITMEKVFISANLGFIFNPQDMMSRTIMKQLSLWTDVEREFIVERFQSGRAVHIAADGHVSRYNVEVPNHIRKKIVELYDETKKMGVNTIAKAVTPFFIKNKSGDKEEILISLEFTN